MLENAQMRSQGPPGALLPQAWFRSARTGRRQGGRPPWRAVYQARNGSWEHGWVGISTSIPHSFPEARIVTLWRCCGDERGWDGPAAITNEFLPNCIPDGPAFQSWRADGSNSTVTVFPSDVPIVAVRVGFGDNQRIGSTAGVTRTRALLADGIRVGNLAGLKKSRRTITLVPPTGFTTT
jgi:hypothetical protein